jgi:hypothetical protein
MDNFEATVLIDRPIEQVFDFLVDGENDKKFSARVLEIEKKTDGPIREGTVYASTVKDAGIKTERELEGQGFGKLIKGFALRSARKSVDGMVQSIKTAIEAE